ncbi:MAG: MarR family transcriptional regulator [Candidatus Omnitrophica bacterium]|nr:MarR family transcriptional regulator [Candidatus Omnitrophota bacterium]
MEKSDFFKTFGVELNNKRYYEEAVYSVALIYNALNNHISRHLKDYGLSVAKFNVLLVIKHQGREEGASQVSISQHLVVTPSNMTRLLDKLEKEKLIRRVCQKGDRRVNLIKITDKGINLLDKIWPGYLNKLQSLSSHITAAEKKIVSTVLIKWLKGVLQ